MTTPQQYAQAHGERFVEELKEILCIPSISTLSAYNHETYRAAEWFRDHCANIGLHKAEVIDTAGHPMVYAEWLGAGPDAPTVLVYGHYDVQPADDPRQEWLSPPFEPEIRGGNLYARGATDDKGQTFIHLKVFESFMQTTGTFPVNLKIMIEGEEESGSQNLHPFVHANLDRLACDVVVISDTEVLSPTQPSITYGLRGMVYTELEVFGPATDLHSGVYGGVVHNPAQALAEIIAKLHDEKTGRVAIPGFYDEVLSLSAADRAAFAEVPADDYQQQTGVPALWGESDYTPLERVGARPTLEINGLVGGWTGQGGKTVIGASALAKISCRLVPHQNPERIFELMKAYIAQITPPTVRSELRSLGHNAPAVLVPLDSKAMQAAAGAFEATFGAKPFFTRSGGSIPVVAIFQSDLRVPVLLMGFGLPDDNLHAPNEKLTLSMFHKGVETMSHFYTTLPRFLAD